MQMKGRKNRPFAELTLGEALSIAKLQKEHTFGHGRIVAPVTHNHMATRAQQFASFAQRSKISHRKNQEIP
jgi:hypothetical protein